MNARKVTAAGAAALLIGGGLGVAALANAADPTPTPTASTSPTTNVPAMPGMGQSPSDKSHNGRGKAMAPGQQMKGGFGFVHGEVAKVVAAKLGLDEAKLTEAAKSVAEQMRTKYQGQAKSGTPMDPTAMKDEFITELAANLGIDKAKLSAAIDEAIAAHQADDAAEHRAELKAKLDKAVADGKITQADEDSILKAFDAGVLGGKR